MRHIGAFHRPKSEAIPVSDEFFYTVQIHSFKQVEMPYRTQMAISRI